MLIPIKVIVIGDSGVGKTSLATYYTTKKGINDVTSTTTIVCECITKPIKIGEHDVSLIIWDTVGQERYATIVQAFYRGSAGVIICFSLDNRESFINVEKYLERIKNNAPSAKMILVGTKNDLGKVVLKSEIEELCGKHSLIYFSTNARNGANIHQAFQTLAHEILADNDLVSKQWGRHNKGIVVEIGKSAQANANDIADDGTSCCKMF